MIVTILLAVLASVSVIANIAILYLTGRGLAESESQLKKAVTLAADALKEASLWKGLCLDMVDAFEALEAKNAKSIPRDSSGVLQ